MKIRISVAVLAAAISFPVVSLAQSGASVAETSAHTVAGNIGLFSSYRFRGIDQTFGKPALQGGVDYSHASGFYFGNWNSNVNSGAGYPNGDLEMDFYGGYKTAFGDFGIDLGALYYYYPGTDASLFANNGKTGNGTVNNKELYVGVSWKFLSLKYSHSIDDYFSTPDSKNSNYFDLSANHDLGNGWGVNAHLGHLTFKNVTNGSYSDWKLGVTKDVSGWVFGAAYVDTNAKGDCSSTAVSQFYCFTNSNGVAEGALTTGNKTKDAGRATVVLSVSKTF
jgi:uncharacterized protein (TIGR02001 family)